jgi:ABC-2 type transport system permease protein
MIMKTLRDTGLIFERSIQLTLRNPAWVVIGVIQPLFFLLLFGPLLEALSGAPGFPSGISPMNIFVPGLLIQLALFSTAFVGFGLIAEVRYGVIERLRVTPVSRLALLLGRALRDTVILIVQAVLLVLCAVPFGLQVNVLGLLVVLALMVLLGLLMVSISYALALFLRSEDALAPLLNTVTLPLLLLSGILLPLTLAPAWLRSIAAANPLSYTVDAARALFNERLTDPSIPIAVILLGILAALALVGASRSFSRSTA